MITIKAGNYSIAQLVALRDILSTGLADFINSTCEPGCERCMFSYLCNDVESTIQYLNKKIVHHKAEIDKNHK